MTAKRFSFLDIILIGLAVALLFTTANEQSLWLDEASTVDLGSPFLLLQGWGPFSDAQMPLSFWMPWFSKMLFGDREIALRLPFLLMGVTMIALFPRLLMLHGAKKASAYIGAFSLLLFPSTLYYAQEVRAYMPMLFFLILWLYLRQTRSKWMGVVCFLFMFSHTFSILYVVSILGIEWLYDRKKAVFQKKELGAIALILPFLILAVVIVRNTFLNPNPALVQTSLIRSLFLEIFSLGFVSYFSRALKYFFGDSGALGFVVCGIAFTHIFFQGFKKSPLGKLSLGLLVGACLHAKVVMTIGFNPFERYLILLVPVIFLSIYSIPSIALSIAVFIVLHLGFSFDFQSRPLQGVVTRLFPRTNSVLVHSGREDWKGVIRFLESQVTQPQTIDFKDCSECSHYTLAYYLRWSPIQKLITVKAGPECQSDWVITQKIQEWPNAHCRKKLVFESSDILLYGSETLPFPRALKGF